MASSINGYLQDISYNRYYLKSDSDENKRIENSVKSLLGNLDYSLGHTIKRRFIFGSYDRDTILRRSIDAHSDVDIMVVFNHTDYERTPETYRTWLKNFADKYYKDRYGSEVVRSSPTVTIRLGNINYDLVPAKETVYQYVSNDLYIPDSGGGWRITDPQDVKTKLLDSNKKYNYVVKPIIRLMKAWNSYNGYPYDSYELELAIIGMNFHNDNYESGFFWAVEYLPLKVTDTQFRKDKVQSLRYNVSKVKERLEVYDLDMAKYWLHKILP